MAVAGVRFSITRRIERTVSIVSDLLERVRIVDNLPLTLEPFDDKAFAAWVDGGEGGAPPILGSIMEFTSCCGRDARLRMIALTELDDEPSEIPASRRGHRKFDLQGVCMACGEQWRLKGCVVSGLQKESYVP